MTSNQTCFLQKYRPARCRNFASNLFTIRSILFVILAISSLIVQHVAEQLPNVNKKPNKFLNTFNQQFYSTKTASSKARWIPEHNLGDLAKNPLLIQTENGPVLGKRVKKQVKTSSNRIEEDEVDAFLGLLYAKAPVKKLRFQRPVPLDKRPWDGHVFNATSTPDSCIQLNDTFFGEFRGSTMWNANTPLSEDCLTLSIWAPASRLKKAKLLPVLVWIYGGAFYSGSIALYLYDGAILAARGDLIVISINYRVASFGFLYLGRDDAPGNMGVVDQLLALRWIKKNIRSFGGDPESITLFGKSAGAATISYLILSPEVERGLFHRAILQSGPASSPWALMTHETAIYRSLRLAENLGCIKPSLSFDLNENKKLVEVQDLRRYRDFDYKNDPNIVKCLQRADALELISNEPNNTKIIEFPFVPVVDGFILPEDPSIPLGKSNLQQFPLLLGSVSNEAIYFLVYQITELLKLNETINVSSKKLESVIRQHFDEPDLVLDAIVQKYTNWKDTENVEINLETIDHVFGDVKFSCPMNALTRRYAEINSTVYQYMFTHRSSFSAWPRWMGILHGDEINFIFGEPLRNGYNYSQAEVKLSKRMIAFWVNFAKSGDPLKADNDLPQLKIPIKDDQWPAYTTENNRFKILNLNISTSVELGSPRPDYCAFWIDYIPKFKEKIRHCNSAASGVQARLILLLSTLAYLFNFSRFGF